jgi:hypothetical protein
MLMKGDTTIKWVPLSVPEDMVPEVMGAVLERVGQAQPPEVAAHPPDDAYHGGWTEDELRDSLKNPTRAMGIVLRYLATHPGDWVEAPELAKEVYGQGASSNQIGGALGAFTRRVHSRYHKTDWPFEARLNEEKKVWEYGMDERTAAVIRRILGI